LLLNLRSSEIHLFYNLGDFYWHFLEILWLFIFLFLYSLSGKGKDKRKINNQELRFQKENKIEIPTPPKINNKKISNKTKSNKKKSNKMIIMIYKNRFIQMFREY